MDYSYQLLFFFSALGSFNGLLLGIYFLIFAQPRNLSNKFLGLLILMLSIRVGKSVFFYFNPDLSFHYLQFGLTACFFIGPFLYFYVKQLTQPQSNIAKEWKYHMMILLPIAIGFGFMYPFETNVSLWRPSVLNCIYYVWFAYILLSIYVSKDSFKRLFTRIKSLDKLDVWVVSLIFGNLILVTIYYEFDITYYISGALSFSFLFYLSWAFLFFNRENRVHYISEQKKYGDLKIIEDEAEKIGRKLSALMENEKVFKKSGLKLPELSAKIQTSPHRLSQYLNENLEKSFSQYINEYRIEEAKRMILENELLTLEGIGYEVGFSSRSTFYSSFKKYEGTTPSKFKKTS